jgi:L-amino acid N-acyltransferase YncA
MTLLTPLIRLATPADAAGVAKVHVSSWRTTYPGVLPDRFLVNLSVDSYARRWLSLLGAEREGRRSFVAVDPTEGIIGFASCGPQRTALPGYGGEFYAIYLYDWAQSQGWGRRMMATMAGELSDSGHRGAVVWVLRDNPARWFYERLGGQRLAEQPISFAGTRLSEVAYGWGDLLPLARLKADPPVS